MDHPSLRLYDACRRETEDFVGAHAVRMYVCGITPYDSAHLGHAFTYSTFDVLVRLLQDRGHEVTYARNVTDVDDDIIRTSRERGVGIVDLVRTETASFRRQMGALGLLTPDVEPLASGTIDAIVAAVQGLIDRGVAYVLDDGRIYLGTAEVEPTFGTRFADLDPATRLERYASSAGDPDAPGKHDPLDILLWQPEPSGADGARWPDVPAWDSPWGAGRPGWHVECSVMAIEHLGPTIDIHGGGSDLAFPHHEAEILQSELLTEQRPFARFWMHVGMVALDGEKMSKSLGNLVYVDDLIGEHPGGAIKRHLLEHHYRSAWEFTHDAQDKATAAYRGWQETAGASDRSDDGLAFEVRAALSDDLDTPRAVRLVDDAADRGLGGNVRDAASLLGIDLG